MHCPASARDAPAPGAVAVHSAAPLPRARYAAGPGGRRFPSSRHSRVRSTTSTCTAPRGRAPARAGPPSGSTGGRAARTRTPSCGRRSLEPTAGRTLAAATYRTAQTLCENLLQGPAPAIGPGPVERLGAQERAVSAWRSSSAGSMFKGIEQDRLEPRRAGQAARPPRRVKTCVWPTMAPVEHAG